MTDFAISKKAWPHERRDFNHERREFNFNRTNKEYPNYTILKKPIYKNPFEFPKPRNVELGSRNLMMQNAKNIKNLQTLRSVKAQTPHSMYNPELIIEPLTFNQKTYNVIRDDYLCGGTKQRGLVPLMENSEATEFVYAGPTTGYAQVALAYAAKITGKRATIIVNREKNVHPFTSKAFNYGAKIIQVSNGHLRKIQIKAESYVENRPFAELIPFGGNSEKFIEYMYDSIMFALPQELIENNPKRLWLVCGSATLLQVLYRVFPTTEFIIIQIGKKIWDDQLQLHRTTKYVANERFQEKAFVMPPYPTVATYDAKLWIYASQHARDGDFIWNVACD